jgi:hypothetical protein
MWIAIFGAAVSTGAGGSLGELLTLNHARDIFDVRALNSSAGMLLLIWLGMLIMLLLPTLLSGRLDRFGQDRPGGENFHANYSI